MTDRERLVELLRKDNCCIDYDCNKCLSIHCYPKTVADLILADGWIRPPCKSGQNVFYIHEKCDENGEDCIAISAGEVVSVSVQAEGLWAYCRYFDGLTFWHRLCEDWNKTLFPTREEAEKALKGGCGVMWDWYPYYRIGMFDKECHPNAVYIAKRSQKLKNKKYRAINKKRGKR